MGGEYNQVGWGLMFDTTGFWQKIILFVIILVAIYAIVNLVFLRKTKNKGKIQNIMINVLLGIGLFYLFLRIFILIPDVLDPGYFFMQTIVNSVTQVCVLALATTGIVLIFKTSTTTNFSQGMVATFGAFVAARLIIHLVATYTAMGNTTVVLLGILGSGITGFLLGICIDVFVIRKSKISTPISKQMITMGLVIMFSGAMPIIFGTLPITIPRLSYDPNVIFTIFGKTLSITVSALYALGISVILLGLLFSALRFTKWGLGVRATASNEVVASMMGVNTRIITAFSWGIAGLLGGVAAVILAPNSGNVQVALMIPTQVNGFMAAILGSFSSFAGPLLASILIPVLSGLLVFVVPLWQNAVVYIIILVIVLVKPFGLFGKPIAKKV